VATRNSIIFAALGLGGAVALVVVGRGGPSAGELGAIAADLDGRVRETAAAAEARAQTLAQLPRLAYAVATDEQTMLDLTSDELAFQPAPGELIEIGQVRRRTGEVASLRRVGGLPGVHLPLADPGQHLLGNGGELQVVAVVGVEPKAHADQMGGAVAVARTVDVSTLLSRLRRAGVAMRVTTHDGAEVALGRAPAGGSVEPLSLYADAAHGATLSALLPSSSLPPLGYLIAAACMLLLGFGGAALTWRRQAPPVDDSPLPDLVPEVHVDLRDRRR
jgi:hypothetical protein